MYGGKIVFHRTTFSVKGRAAPHSNRIYGFLFSNSSFYPALEITPSPCGGILNISIPALFCYLEETPKVIGRPG